MRVLGAILIVLGILFSLSIFGAVIGIPMIFIGLILVAVGGRRKTVITNVVQVSTGGEGLRQFPDPAQLVRDPELPPRREPQPLPYAGPTLQLPADRRERATLHSGRLSDFAESDFDPDPDPSMEERFADARSEVTPRARTLLKAAKDEGFEIKVRDDSFVIRKGGYEVVLQSNSAIEEFGRRRGYPT